MKKGLLATTALAGLVVIANPGAAGAAEAPEWNLGGNMNFQFYWVDQDLTETNDTRIGTAPFNSPTGTQPQDHGWYFGVDEAELKLNVSGIADNGLNYGFKIEINVNTSDDSMADEARIELSGNWGVVQMGDEDGAEDIMNFGGENLMGATGGFDGDQDDYLYRFGGGSIQGNDNFSRVLARWRQTATTSSAPGYPTIAGDTGDATKVSYFSPRFSGFQVGASLTPGPGLGGDDFKEDTGRTEDHYGLGANYDNTFGNLRLRASAVYSTASSTRTNREDIAAWSVGGIVGWGAFSLGGNYTDNGESGLGAGSGWETSYWNAAASWESGPMSFAAGYFAGNLDTNFRGIELNYTHIALTADYTMAPGLGVYAEVNVIEEEIWFISHETTSFVIGANVSF